MTRITKKWSLFADITDPTTNPEKLARKLRGIARTMQSKHGEDRTEDQIEQFVRKVQQTHKDLSLKEQLEHIQKIREHLDNEHSVLQEAIELHCADEPDGNVCKGSDVLEKPFIEIHKALADMAAETEDEVKIQRKKQQCGKKCASWDQDYRPNLRPNVEHDQCAGCNKQSCECQNCTCGK